MSQPESFCFDSDTQQFLDSYANGAVDWGQDPSAAQQRAIGLQLYGGGHFREAEFCLRTAHHFAIAEHDQRLEALIKLDLGRTLIQIDPREALALLLSLHANASSNVNRVCLYVGLGSVLIELCRFDFAETCFRVARDAHAHTPDNRFFAYSQANRARNAFQLGKVELASQLHLDAQKRLSDLGEDGSQALVLTNIGIHLTMQRRFDQAFATFEQSQCIQAGTGNERLATLLDLGLAELEMLCGDVESAQSRLTKGELKDIAFPGLQARKLVLRSILDRKSRATELLRDLEAVASDLYSRDLREDSAIVYLMSAAYAEHEGVSSDKLFGAAQLIFGEQPGLQYLADHYSRIVSSVKYVRKKTAEQELPLFLTQAPEVVKLKEKLVCLARTDVRVLIEGESGTGKTFLARLMHEEGERSSAPFIVVDCTNLDANLFESKLFGHVRGSFTGAVTDAVGLVEQANKGTLFLDEIGELPGEIQAKLLYTIEEQRYRPIGSRMEKQADFRVIAATNRDIDRMLSEGSLRKDLFFRIAGYRVYLPPLRKRREDVVPLTEHRLGQLNLRYGRRKTLRAGVWESLVLYDWPGNVRELYATLERGFHLAVGRHIDLDDLGLGMSGMSKVEDLSWYTIRRAHLLRVLRLCRGNVTQAARLLGLNRTTLIYKLKLLDIERRDFDPEKAAAEDPPRWVAEEEQEPDIGDSAEI